MGSYFSVPLAVSIAIPLIAGSIVSASTAENVMVWYKTLKKPSWNLPTPIFGPTWSFLYVFMGLASFVVWTQGGFAEQTGPLVLYAVNLALNLAWMPIFFNQKNLELAQIDNAATLVTAIVLAKWFYRVKPVAGYLLWPYVAFLAFANALNWFHVNNNADRTIEEDLYEPSTKKNPGQAGYEPPSAGNPQGYKYGEDPAAVPAADKAKSSGAFGSGVSGAIGREQVEGIEYGGSTTGEPFQRPGGSTTGGSFKPKPTALGNNRMPVARPARMHPARRPFLGRTPSRVAATASRSLAAVRFA